MQAGTLIAGRYQVEREIGRGNFGIVYLVHDRQTNEPRAIKVLLPWAARNEQLRHRLRREARLAGSLTNPHAVKTYEAGETAEGDVFLVMEYLRGEELTETLRHSAPLPASRVESIARQVLAALADAHQRGVIHRDLKPSNIYLCASESGDDLVKVFDFGIAKVTGDGDLMATAKLTVSGGVMGTPVYMSPEQCRGEELTPASDFYSLGIVLYEMLTGHVPFDDENPVRVLLAHNQEPLPPLPEPIADSPLGRAVTRALSKSPAERFATAEQFLAAIEGAEIPLPTKTAPASEPATLQSASPSRAVGKPAAKPSPAGPALPGGWALWLSLAVLLLVAAIVVAVVGQ